MEQNSSRKLEDIAYLFSQIQKHAKALSGDAGGIVQQFFDSQFSIADISQIYELPANKVREVIIDFLVELLANRHGLQRFLSLSCLEGEDTVVDPREEANLLIETCETPESTSAKIREMIGTAIRISIPPAPPNLCAETISKIDIVRRRRTRHPEKFPANLRERNFSLGYQKAAAGVEVTQVTGSEVTEEPKTCSDGVVLLERGAEKVKVDFYIALQEKKAAEKANPKYEIIFHNLPGWAIPVSFSFVGPDDLGTMKEYELPSKFCEERLYFEVENEEQENAFLDRTEAYIGFIISGISKV